MQIHISRGEDQSGPFTLEEVREQLVKGKLQPDDLACQEGGSEWIPLSELMNKLASSEQVLSALDGRLFMLPRALA